MAGDSSGSAALPDAKAVGIDWWRIIMPIAVAIVIALIPAPAGLGQHAWYYFALFAGVVAALVLEPLPSTAVGFIAITLTAVLSRWTLFSNAELAKPGFNVASETVKWAFSGFASNTVWLVGGAFMLALGYQKNRSRTSHCIAIGAGPRKKLVVARLRRNRCRYHPRPVHPLESGTQCRDHVPGHDQSAADLRFKAKRSVGPQDRRIYPLGNLRGELHHEFAVYDRMRS